VLYYNTALVDEPKQQLFDLFASATISEPLALETTFDGAFWGSVVFGGEVFPLGEASQPQNLDLSRTSLVKWLGWLRSNKDRPGIVMNNNPAQLREMFAVGNAAYLISSSDALAQLRLEMNGDEGAFAKIGVVPLPDGSAGEASPFLTVNGFFFSAEAGEEQTQMALEFAKFATSGSSQARLMETAHQAPANVLALTLVDDAALNSVVEQARSSVLLPPRPVHLLLQEGGNALYQHVLEDDVDPSSGMATFTTFMNETPPAVLITNAGQDVLICEQEGRQCP